MHPRSFALISGIVFLLFGVLAFFPGLLQTPYSADPVMEVSQGYGRFLGLFPTNLVLKIVHILIGLAGIAAFSSKFRSLPASLNFNRGLFAVVGAMSILGMVDAWSTVGGYAPLFSHNIWLHGFGSLLAGYLGFRMPAEIRKSPIVNAPITGRQPLGV